MTQQLRIPTRRKMLYVLAVTVMALLVCEGALRARAWIRYGSATPGGLRDPMLTYDRAADLYLPTPGYEIRGAKIHIRINSRGFRGDEFAIPKPPHTFRIVCLGASTTFSAEASSNDAIWTHRLQEKLRVQYPNQSIEVINAAVGGYVADDNLKNLRHRVLALEPDLVIYYEANNEIVSDTQTLAKQRGLLTATAGRRDPLVVRTLSRYSLMFDLVYKNVAILSRGRAGARTDSGKLDSVPTNLPDRFIGVLDNMRQELAARNVPFVLSTFIVKYRRDQNRDTQVTNADVAFYYMPWMSIEGMLHAVDTYNNAIVNYAHRAGLLVVDDRFVIPADAQHFVDCMHLTDRGNEVMAERFFRALVGAGLVERGRTGGLQRAANLAG